MPVQMTPMQGSDNSECFEQSEQAVQETQENSVQNSLESKAAKDLDENPTVPEGWSKTWFLVCLSLFLCQLMGYMAEPLFNCKAKRLCGEVDGVGVFTNIYVITNLTQLCFTPLLGWLSDRFGRKPILVSIFTTTLASIIVFEMATSTSGLYISSVLRGMSPVTAIYVAMLGDMVPKSLRTRYICWLFGVGSVGTGLSAFGPAVAEWGGITVSMLATIIAVIGAIIMLLTPKLIPKEHGRVSKEHPPASKGNLILLLIVLGSIMCYKLSQNIEVVTRQHVLEHHYPETYCFGGENATQTAYEYLFLGIQLARALANVLAGFLSREFLVAAGTIVGLAIVLLVSAFKTHMLMSSAMTILVHALIGISNPMYWSITSQIAGSEEQGMMIGVLSFCKDLSTVAAYKLGQYLWNYGSDARDSVETWAAVLPASIGSVCALAAAMLLMIAYKRRPEHAKRF